MITNKKLMITVYCAENTLSGKKYIGQSCRPIMWRRQQHYNSAKKANHKFAEALKYYSKESWLWYPLCVVECSKANEYEAFYIRDLNTFEDGYNTQKVSSFENKIDSTKYSSNIYSVYKPEIGTIIGTKSELTRKYPELEEVRHLISGRRPHIQGWVLSEHKDKYKEIESKRNRFGKLITLVHKEHGTHTLLQVEFIKRFGLSWRDISGLLAKRRTSSKGWSLPETLEPLKLENLTISLFHKEHGQHTLTCKEFKEKFDLDKYALSKIEKGIAKSHKNWKLVKEKNEKSNQLLIRT